MAVLLIEALHAEGEQPSGPPSAYRVKLIKAGRSKNGNNYPLSVLHEAAQMYDGARVLSRGDDAHLQSRGKDARNLVGWIKSPTKAPDGLDGVLHISEAAGWLKTLLWDAWQNGKKDIVGLSHVAEASNTARVSMGRTLRDVTKINKVHFVDVVIDPSAGGEIMSLAEADAGRSGIMNREQLLKLIEALSPTRYKALSVDTISEAELVAELDKIVAEAHRTETPPAPSAAGTADLGAQLKTLLTEAFGGMREEMTKITAEATARLERDRSEHMAEAMLSESNLPQEARPRILAQVRATAKPATKDEVKAMLVAEAQYLGLSRGWNGPGSVGGGVTVMRDEMDKMKAALDGLMSGERTVKLSEAQGDTIESYQSIREAYIDLTGDKRVTGQIAHATRLPQLAKLAEAALTTSDYMTAITTGQGLMFGGILGDSMRRAMQRDYRNTPYGAWKALFDVVPISDFRYNFRPQIGGFADLAIVNEAAAYVAFTATPDDVSPYYKAQKRGAIQELTLEMIVNDDVGMIRRMPQKMSRAAARTLNAFAFNLITSNGNFTGDGVALFHATHGNLGASALSDAAIKDGRLQMMKQVEQGSSEQMNISPKYVLVPVDLESQAVELCFANGQPLLNLAVAAATESMTRPNFLRRIGLEPLVFPHSTGDTDNWFLAADKMDIPIGEIGFLNGNEEPELYIQDQPTNGSMFTNDKITYKVRHPYGGAIVEYRGLQGNIVA